MKVPIQIKREEGEFTKERRKYVTKFEEVIIQEIKEDIIEKKCESCKNFTSARTVRNINDRVIPIQIRLNDTQDDKEYEKSKHIIINQEKNLEEKDQTKNGKVIRIKSPMINSVEVNDGKPATIGNEKMTNSYSKHFVEKKVTNIAKGKDERNNTDIEQQQKANMLDKRKSNFQQVVLHKEIL